MICFNTWLHDHFKIKKFTVYTSWLLPKVLREGAVSAGSVGMLPATEIFLKNITREITQNQHKVANNCNLFNHLNLTSVLSFFDYQFN